jgi:hypothetical protein
MRFSAHTGSNLKRARGQGHPGIHQGDIRTILNRPPEFQQVIVAAYRGALPQNKPILESLVIPPRSNCFTPASQNEKSFTKANRAEMTDGLGNNSSISSEHVVAGAQVSRRLRQPVKIDQFTPRVALSEASAHDASLSSMRDC